MPSCETVEGRGKFYEVKLNGVWILCVQSDNPVMNLRAQAQLQRAIAICFLTEPYIFQCPNDVCSLFFSILHEIVSRNLCLKNILISILQSKA